MDLNQDQLNTNNVGRSVDNTTNYLKKLSDFIEKKLYDSEGNIKNGGVKSISLVFSMLVGFSMAIVVLSTILITFILLTKSTTIDEKNIEIIKLEKEVIKEKYNVEKINNKYMNVYSKCDSIGFERAKQALDFSRNVNQEVITQKNKIDNSIKQNLTELKELKNYNKQIKTLQNKIK